MRHWKRRGSGERANISINTQSRNSCMIFYTASCHCTQYISKSSRWQGLVSRRNALSTSAIPSSDALLPNMGNRSFQSEVAYTSVWHVIWVLVYRRRREWSLKGSGYYFPRPLPVLILVILVTHSPILFLSESWWSCYSLPHPLHVLILVIRLLNPLPVLILVIRWLFPPSSSCPYPGDPVTLSHILFPS